ncbi:glycosyltransferase family 4 protein [Candidatus Collierbacteria bacterium]|nr:glycosyltransferase family 4 protein [Candidatus Collierbacteria bacterium]
MKKIVIDARLSGLEHAGIGRYVEMLTRHIELKSQNSKLKVNTINPKIKHYTLAEQIQMPGILRLEKPDLVHFPHFNVPLFYNKPFVVTIHDLLWHEQVGPTATTLPVWIYWLKYLFYRLVLRHAVLKSRAIIVPSNWVKKKIVERFPEAEGKINVIYEGVSEVFKGPALPQQGRAFVDSPYIIYTGSLYPHKNVNIILDILPRFPEIKFVVACARNVFWEKFRKEVENRGLKDMIVLAGFVPDNELAALYRNALAFVFPSKSEGFGLPGLEAMAAGCPVVSSNAGSLPEVYGNAVLYFDPKNETELIEKIGEIRDNQGYRKKMIELGQQRAKMFGWKRCAEETLKIYNKVIND